VGGLARRLRGGRASRESDLMVDAGATPILRREPMQEETDDQVPAWDPSDPIEPGTEAEVFEGRPTGRRVVFYEEPRDIPEASAE